MAWEDEIQKTKSILGDVGSIVEQGLGIFQSVKETIVPTSTTKKTTAETVPTKAATTGAVTSQQSVQGTTGMFAGLDIKVIAVIGVIGYLLLAARK
jgi:hypothetical protein